MVQVVEALAGGRSAYRDALAGMDHDKLEDMIDDVRDVCNTQSLMSLMNLFCINRVYLSLILLF